MVNFCNRKMSRADSRRTARFTIVGVGTRAGVADGPLLKYPLIKLHSLLLVNYAL